MFSLILMSVLSTASADLLPSDGGESSDGPIICTPEDADGNGIPDVDEEDADSDDEGGIFDWLDSIFDWLGGTEDGESDPDSEPDDGTGHGGSAPDEPGTSPDTGTCPGDLDIPDCDGEGGVCEMPSSVGGMHSKSELLLDSVHKILSGMSVGETSGWQGQGTDKAIRFIVTSRHSTDERRYTQLSVQRATNRSGRTSLETLEVWVLEETDQIFFLTDLDQR